MAHGGQARRLGGFAQAGIAGPPSKLAPEHGRLIPDLLSHGAEAHGFRGEVWTCGRVARVIAEEFGVAYHKRHVAKLLRGLGWTLQVPVKRAMQRDDQEVEHWRHVVWPGLKAQAHKERRTIVFIDESGLYLLPAAVRTYGRKGATPVVHEWQSREHLSVMGGVEPAGKIYVLVRRRSLNGLHTVEFLKHLLRHVGRRLMVLWDGSPIHRRREVKDFLAGDEGRRVRAERLPAYAPDLNPLDASIWNRLKNVEMRNRACLDLEELHLEFHLAVGRLRQKPWLIRSSFAAAGLV
jgi:transposase